MNFRELLMVAAKQGGGASAVPPAAAWPSLIGAERIQGGGCTDPNDWTLGTGVTVNVVPGKMVATAASSVTTNDGLPADSTVVGGTYRTVFTIDTVSLGTALITIGGADGTIRSTVGTFSQDIVSDDGAGWRIEFTSATMQLDNFSVKSVGLLGIETDWTFVGSVWFATGQINVGSTNGDTATLAGSAKTAFDAAVSNSTACTVTLSTNPNEDTLTGTVAVTMKGGSPVNFVFERGGADVSHTVSSGTGSGFVITSGNDSPAGNIARVQIALA